jgi:hypothetical protein
MTKKAEFNAEEWSKVTEGPLIAGMRVVAADKGGTIRETLAMGKVYTHARESSGESELLDELVTSPPSLKPGEFKSQDELSAATVERLNDALRLVEAKATPEEVDAYKKFVTSVAEAAANAHKEGGILGIGGKQVSDDERKALDEIAGVLS